MAEIMPVKLYKLDASPPARAAKMACELFSVPAEMINVNVLEKEHLKPEYLKKNPVHSVPVLEDGDLHIIDSHAILMYVADIYGKKDSLYPKDTKKRAVVNQFLFFDSSILFARLRNITFKAISEGRIAPTESQLKDIDEAYGYLEEFLTRNKFLAGNDLTIADVACIASVSSLNIILPLDVKKYPKVAAWVKVLEKEPFYKKHNEPGLNDFKMIYEKFRCRQANCTYKQDFSPPAQTVMIAYDMFGVPVEMIDLNLFKGRLNKRI